MSQGLSHDDFLITRAVKAVPGTHLDGRLPANIWARVTDIKDPEKLGRLKCKFYWQEEEGVAEMETGWITRNLAWAGPTRMSRGRRFGSNVPHPEVGSLAILRCMNGDIHDLVYDGQPEYMEGDLGAPPSDKDDHTDWCFRISLPNGYEFAVDTEGNKWENIPGNWRVKVGGSIHISARGIITFFAPMFRAFTIGILRLLGAKVETHNWPSPEEAAQLREMTIDAMKMPPGREDPGIGKVEDDE
jgi:hypothetical protein